MSLAPRPTIPALSSLDLVLPTARLRLRPLAPSDLDDLWPSVSDPEFPRLMSWNAHTDRAETAAFIASTCSETERNGGVTWAVEHDQRVIGTVGLGGMQWGLRAWRVDRAELGYWIARDRWGQGIATEAADAVIRCGFHTIGLHKITVGCISENVASRRVIEKLGFRYVGVLEDDVWRDGRWWSHLRYEMTSPEWPDVHTTMRVHRPRLS